MKLIDYAHKMAISYKTAWRWYKAGKLPGKQMDTGTILGMEDESEKSVSRNWRRRMQLVEQHVIKRTDRCYQAIDRVAFASKNLYNAALYEMRQSFIFGGKRLDYPELYHRMKAHPTYKALPAKVAQ